MNHNSARAPNASLGSLPSSWDLVGHQGLHWELEGKDLLWTGHSNKRNWWLQWNFVGVLCLRPQMQYSTSGQTMRGACIWVVPHSECSPGCVWFTQLSAFFRPNHDQEPQPDPPQTCEEMGVDNFSGCTWPTLSGEIPVQQTRPDTSPGKDFMLVGSGTFLTSSPPWNIMEWQH